MSLLRKITGKESTPKADAIEVPPCPHTALVPRWDSVDDMGKEDRATSYFCQGCEQTFTPEEARPFLG